MHNAGFNRLGLPHHYGLHETSSAEEALEAMRHPNFGGASVTIPLKETILPMMDELSDAARAIGAVNTVIRVTGGNLRGDNTDWIGIRDSISRVLDASTTTASSSPPCPSSPSHSPFSFPGNHSMSGSGESKWKGMTGLVVGAGGTARAACYCLKTLGVQLYIYNRTYAKAAALADEFGGSAVKDLEAGTPAGRAQIVLCTVPASAGFKLPEEEKDEASVQTPPVVVLDAAYRPRRTALLMQQAGRSGSAANCVEGIDMLICQGLAQLKLWTGLSDLPASVKENIDARVRSFYEESSEC